IAKKSNGFEQEERDIGSQRADGCGDESEWQDPQGGGEIAELLANAVRLGVGGVHEASFPRAAMAPIKVGATERSSTRWRTANFSSRRRPRGEMVSRTSRRSRRPGLLWTSPRSDERLTSSTALLCWICSRSARTPMVGWAPSGRPRMA